jgi:hypothetical protein
VRKQGREIGKKAKILPNAGCWQNLVLVKYNRLAGPWTKPQLVNEISVLKDKTQPLGLG